MKSNNIYGNDNEPQSQGSTQRDEQTAGAKNYKSNFYSERDREYRAKNSEEKEADNGKPELKERVNSGEETEENSGHEEAAAGGSEKKGRKRRGGDRSKCFENEDKETQKKKTAAMEKFYKSQDGLSQTEEKLAGIFREIFAGLDIDETPEDELQNIAEQLLTKKSWDVEKHPDYKKQVMYVIRYNLIPGMINKYYGRKKSNISDEELQLRNYYGTGNRNTGQAKNIFKKDGMKEFDINPEYGHAVIEAGGIEKHHRIERASYETEEESRWKFREEEIRGDRLKAAEKIINEKGDFEVKLLWWALKKAAGKGKINVELAKKMERTPEEVKMIRRRLRKLIEEAS